MIAAWSSLQLLFILRRWPFVLWMVLIASALLCTNGFSTRPIRNHSLLRQRRRVTSHLYMGEALDDRREEARIFFEKARKIRDEIGDAGTDQKTILKANTRSASLSSASSPWGVESEEEGEIYRLYIDIGREEGTWMDRRWGASGRRIPLTVDVKLLKVMAPNDMAAKMVKDNFMGQSSPVYMLETAKAARLRDGFDKMICFGGCYRIDSANGKETIRFFIEVDGTTENQDFGDVSVPAGRLYFSLPCFGMATKQLSTKEGLVTVRQIGWNTGWRREESRIVGIFFAKPLEIARKRDRF